MRMKHGGEMRVTHNTIIKDGCLEISNPKINVGEKESMVFTEGGPFDLPTCKIN
jgi:hypothetical protein